MFNKDEVRDANILLHSALAGNYKDTEPHYRKENILRVGSILQDLQRKTCAESLLDIGCGMGFIIDIAKPYFRVIRGVDITPAMLEKVDTSSEYADVKVQLAPSDSLPFESGFFDVCTAYAVLHHLDVLLPTFQEICRVLKKGGMFYSDLDPNYYFWDAVSRLPEDRAYSDFVRREIDAVIHKDQELEDLFHIDKGVLRAAEHLKHEEGGFREEDLRDILYQAGFSEVTVQYEWFLGEAKVIHGEQAASADALRGYLRDALPLTRHLFKYLMVYARK